MTDLWGEIPEFPAPADHHGSGLVLRSARVRTYKNILDSGDVDLSGSLVALVGRNESGKTSFMEALYRLNPAQTGHAQDFDAERDFPRAHYRDDLDLSQYAPITAAFELTPEAFEALEATFGEGILTSNRLTLSRRYTGSGMWAGMFIDEKVAAAYCEAVLKVKDRGAEDLNSSRRAWRRGGPTTGSSRS